MCKMASCYTKNGKGMLKAIGGSKQRSLLSLAGYGTYGSFDMPFAQTLYIFT